jgi:tetratricopeptide (TPR) repeat protein
MAVDMLDFAGEELYFDEAMELETEQCIEQAAENYGGKNSENLLLRAYFLEPEHPMVLVALYRYYYYQHRYADALRVAERVLKIFAGRLGLSQSWQEVSEQQIEAAIKESMIEVRFYLLALKGSGYLEMRLEHYHSAIERLQKIVAIDAKDRLSVSSLLQIAEDEINRKAGIYRLRF